MTTRHYAWLIILASALFFACQSSGKKQDVPTVGFVEAFEDATIAQARLGFIAALRDSGYSEEKGTLEIIQRNAQGDAATLNQIISYFNSQQPALIGTSTTLATMAAVQRIHDIPVFQTVTAMPSILGVLDNADQPPSNLLGT